MTPRRRTVDGARISGPGELLQAVPYLVGFHPVASLVLVGLDLGRLVVTARLDLVDAVPAGLQHAVTAMARGGSTSFVAAVYADPPGTPGNPRLPWADLTRDIGEAVAGVDADLLDTLLVVEDRWWSLCCTDADCCPDEGQQLPQAPSPFTAAATVDGVVVLPDRGALEAALDPLPATAREPLRPLIAAAERAAVQRTLDGDAHRWALSVKRALFKAARAADAGGGAGLSDQRAAEFGVALATIAIRDAVWLAIDNRRLDGRLLWRELGRRLPNPYDAPALFLYGWASWRAGDGASAGIAADLATASNPDYTAADLLHAAVSSAVSPHRMPRLRMPKSTQSAFG